MMLIAGLGNPGSRYRDTRHNLGFMVLDFMAEEKRFGFKPGKGDYEYAETSSDTERILWVKPMTFMNNSGVALAELARFYKIDADRILVVCDDVSLPLGKMRIRKDGGDGGHNGLKSVILHLNDDRFTRLRVGINHPDSRNYDLADFVLAKFFPEELPVLNKVIAAAADAVSDLITTGVEKAMNKYNGLVIQA